MPRTISPAPLAPNTHRHHLRQVSRVGHQGRHRRRHSWRPAALGVPRHRAPTSLIGGLRANLYYVSPTQINFLVPANLLPGTVYLYVMVDATDGPSVPDPRWPPARRRSSNSTSTTPLRRAPTVRSSRRLRPCPARRSRGAVRHRPRPNHAARSSIRSTRRSRPLLSPALRNSVSLSMALRSIRAPSPTPALRPGSPACTRSTLRFPIGPPPIRKFVSDWPTRSARPA